MLVKSVLLGTSLVESIVPKSTGIIAHCGNESWRPRGGFQGLLTWEKVCDWSFYVILYLSPIYQSLHV